MCALLARSAVLAFLAMDGESFYIKQSDDDGEDRVYYTIKACTGDQAGTPCSIKSWKAASIYSFTGPETALEKLALHLQFSGYHKFSAEKAFELAQLAEVVSNLETAEDRRQYRDDIDRINEHKVADDEAPPEPAVRARSGKSKGKGYDKGNDKGKGKGKAKGKPNPHGVHQAIGAQPRSSSSRLAVTGEYGDDGDDDNVCVSKVKLQVMADSLLRMKNAASGMRSIAMQSASRANELAMAFQAGAQQFQQEVSVLTAAENTIRNVIAGEADPVDTSTTLMVSPF